MCNDNHFLADLPEETDSDFTAAAPAAAADRDMRGRLQSAPDAMACILAGKSTVTLVSGKTGARFTCRISATPDGSAHFAHLFGIDLEPRAPVPTMESAARKVLDGQW